MRIGLWQSLPGNQVHDGCSSWWQFQSFKQEVTSLKRFIKAFYTTGKVPHQTYFDYSSLKVCIIEEGVEGVLVFTNNKKQITLL